MKKKNNFNYIKKIKKIAIKNENQNCKTKLIFYLIEG
jgi:hypothetical protein